MQLGLFCQGAGGGGAGSPAKARATAGLVLPQGCSCLQHSFLGEEAGGVLWLPFSHSQHLSCRKTSSCPGNGGLKASRAAGPLFRGQHAGGQAQTGGSSFPVLSASRAAFPTRRGVCSPTCCPEHVGALSLPLIAVWVAGICKEQGLVRTMHREVFYLKENLNKLRGMQELKACRCCRITDWLF